MQTFLRSCLISLIILPLAIYSQNVAINNTGAIANPSAMLDIQSNSKGVLIPRMTTAERIAITTPATGLLVFDNSTGSFWFRKSTGWQELIDESNSPWLEDASFNLRTRNGGDVSITPGSPIGSGRLNVVSETAAANTTESIVQLYRTTTGTAATGLGGSIDFYNELSTGSFTPTNKIICESINTTSGNYSSSMELLTASGGMLTTQVYVGPANVGIGTTVPSIAAKLDVNGNINTSTKFIRATVTGTSNLVPLCYGTVDAAGNITSGTGNFTILKTSTGTYTISNASFDGACVIIVTPGAPNIGSFTYRTMMSTFFSGDFVVMAFSSPGVQADCGFNFLVYKL